MANRAQTFAVWGKRMGGEKERPLFKGVVFDDFMYVFYIEFTFEEYEYAVFFRVFRGTNDDYDLANDFLVFFEKYPDVFIVLLSLLLPFWNSP